MPSVKICVKFRNGGSKERGRDEWSQFDGRTFGRVEIFGVEIYLAEQIRMQIRKKILGVSAASGRRLERKKRSRGDCGV